MTAATAGRAFCDLLHRFKFLLNVLELLVLVQGTLDVVVSYLHTVAHDVVFHKITSDLLSLVSGSQTAFYTTVMIAHSC